MDWDLTRTLMTHEEIVTVKYELVDGVLRPIMCSSTPLVRELKDQRHMVLSSGPRFVRLVWEDVEGYPIAYLAGYDNQPGADGMRIQRTALEFYKAAGIVDWKKLVPLEDGTSMPTPVEEGHRQLINALTNAGLLAPPSAKHNPYALRQVVDRTVKLDKATVKQQRAMYSYARGVIQVYRKMWAAEETPSCRDLPLPPFPTALVEDVIAEHTPLKPVRIYVDVYTQPPQRRRVKKTLWVGGFIRMNFAALDEHSVGLQLALPYRRVPTEDAVTNPFRSPAFADVVQVYRQAVGVDLADVYDAPDVKNIDTGPWLGAHSGLTPRSWQASGRQKISRTSTHVAIHKEFGE